MDNNYKKALEKVKNAQKNSKLLNCCYQVINPTNILVGPTGPKGEPGPTGPQGIEGPQGIQGLQGEIGPMGPQGIQGLQGMIGPTGDTGPQGLPGEIGPTGPAGTSVNIMGSYDNLAELMQEHSTGNLGDSYLVGPDLYVWSNNDNSWKNVGTIKGPQGNIGPIGPKGEPGPPGPKGEQGIQGIQGVKGEEGLQGPRGEQGEQEIQGPQGIDGPPGPQGPTGPTGPIGTALLAAYGGKFNNISSVINTTQAGNWIQIPLIENMTNINIKESIENTIVIDQDGVYEINYSLNATANKTTTITIWIRENQVMIPSTVLAKPVLANNEISFYGSTIVELKADDYLDMELSATEDDVAITLATGVSAMLSVKKIDELE